MCSHSCSHRSSVKRNPSDYTDELTRIAAGESSWIWQHGRAGIFNYATEVPVELSLSTWKSGQAPFYTGVIRDISERKQAAEALRQRERNCGTPRNGSGRAPRRRRPRFQ